VFTVIAVSNVAAVIAMLLLYRWLRRRLPHAAPAP
jgi:hypothetical protein